MDTPGDKGKHDKTRATLTIKDKSALYLAYMPFVTNGGMFVPTNSSYKLGDEMTFSYSFI